jgi:hypothetical protein
VTWQDLVAVAALSHAAYGAGGGVLYILRQLLKGYRVKPLEYVARPVFGAIAAHILTVVMHLPNHTTSLFVGYFGVDVWDALATRFEGKFAGFFKHEKPPEPPQP